ncbi:MAG: hypothetical protein CVV27_10010, partial [Candidatus Melainabacteria bacterium HGW-Melainabacteria-1]
MKNQRIVIVGGVAGGATAAAKARRTNESAEIILFERGPHISFANCGLPYFIGGEIPEHDSLLVTTPEAFSARYRIQVNTRHEVMALDPELRLLKVRDQHGSLQEVRYDKLILSQGAEAIVPAIPGVDLAHVFTLRNIEDMDRIIAWLDSEHPRQAVVVGGGYIGLEMAPHILPRLETDLAAELESQVLQPGFKIHSRRQVVEILPDAVLLDDGTRLAADLVMLGVGVRPENRLAKAAGLELGITGGLKTNGQMQTSDPNIYAVGDMAEVRHRLTGAAMRIPLAGPANRQGRVAGANAAGAHLNYGGG